MLESFHPLLQDWFSRRFVTPTSAQKAAWDAARKGEHFLLSAPTGSGKTLSAFLWAIHRLISEPSGEERVRVLYISPLKALNSDIKKNLETPLAEILSLAQEKGVILPPVTVGLRSGDTSPLERQKHFRHPPDIFITTPESLNLILTSRRGESFFCGLETVIIDELHSMMPGKRGVHLMSAVERLTLYAGEFRRIGLSATVRPPERACSYLGGYAPDGSSRTVRWLEPVAGKKKEIRVVYPFTGEGDRENPMAPLVKIILDRIRENRSTLVFVATRSLSEGLTRMINEESGDLTAYAHHGSLSREIRETVEDKLKKGELKAIIATSSLELGIDIGTLDEVILAGTPLSQASLIQRLGRSGHGVGETSRGLLLPLSPQDLIFAASAARSVRTGEVEEMNPPKAPLDILCQIILSMCCTRAWQGDSLYAFIRQCDVYRDLTRRQFDLVLNMLEGRYAQTRIPELTPRIRIDKESGLISARDSAPSLLYLSGGSIADRGHFRMVLAEGGTKIGDLDEKFVWENRVGSVFPMSNRLWKITTITDRDVQVVPTGELPSSTPFWRAEGQYGPSLPACRTGELLRTLWESGKEKAQRILREQCFLDPDSSSYLMEILEDYSEKTGAAGPHRKRIVQEIHPSAQGGRDDRVMIIHTYRGGRVNFLLALCLTSLWERENAQSLDFLCDESSLILRLPAGTDPENLLPGLCRADLESLIRRGLESTAFFGTHFRETASHALLLPRQSFRKRQPLWLTRQKSKKLLNAVSRFEDFPVLAETWRTCLQDESAPGDLQILIDQIATGEVELTTLHPREIPLLSISIMGKETAARIASDDTPASGLISDLSGEIIREMMAGSLFRPRIRQDIISEMEGKKSRIHPGYTPRDLEELMLHLEDHQMIPLEEWNTLVERTASEQFSDPDRAGKFREKLTALVDPRGRAYVSHGNRSWDRLPPGWLDWYGPLPLSRISALLGVDRNHWLSRLEEETDAGDGDQGGFMIDYLSEGAEEEEICSRESLEILLRMQRRRSAGLSGEYPVTLLPLLIREVQKSDSPEDDPEEVLRRALEPLLAYPAEASVWEKDLLPARMDNYHHRYLDNLLLKDELIWTGRGRERILFSIPEEYPLLAPESEDPPDPVLALLKEGPRDYSSLRQELSMDGAGISRRLWELLWEGLITSDRPETLRTGIRNKFRPEIHREPAEPVRRTGSFGSRQRFSRWKQSRPLTGRWHPLPSREEGDLLEENEKQKEIVRILLDRYGILFRELVNREKGILDWNGCFRALRQMEFSGEVYSGVFFKGIPGLQFIRPGLLEVLPSLEKENGTFWCSTLDPLSPCGLTLDFGRELPVRHKNSYLVFGDGTLVMTSRKNSKILEIFQAPESYSPEGPEKLFRHLLGRQSSPLNRLVIEEINGVPAAESDYAENLLDQGFRRDYKFLIRHRNPLSFSV